jgi:hypothetical protein
MSRSCRQCGILNISQPCGPPRPVRGRAFTLQYVFMTLCLISRAQGQLYRFLPSRSLLANKSPSSRNYAGSQDQVALWLLQRIVDQMHFIKASSYSHTIFIYFREHYGMLNWHMDSFIRLPQSDRPYMISISANEMLLILSSWLT